MPSDSWYRPQNRALPAGWTRCPHCDAEISPSHDSARQMIWRLAILRQTPAEVWREYEADGINMHEAVKVEMSYAE